MSDFDKAYENYKMFVESQGQPWNPEPVTVKNKETGTEFKGNLIRYSNDYDPRTGNGVFTVELIGENAHIDCGASTWEIYHNVR